MAANIIIEQTPQYKTLPAAQDIIFTVSENAIVTTETRVKFIAEVYVSRENAILVLPSSRVATLKTTPNNAGVGIFDISAIIESYVSPDHQGSEFTVPDPAHTSEYKEVAFSEDKQFPVHIIDKYALNMNSTVYFQVNFKIEYLVGNYVVTDDDITYGDEYYVFNGYTKNEDILTSTFPNRLAGLNLYEVGTGTTTAFSYIQHTATSRFLSSAPLVQYARMTDYGTVAMFNRIHYSDYSFTTAPSGADNEISYINIILYDADDVQIGSPIVVSNNSGNGGTNSGYDEYASQHLLFFGVYPGNLENWSGAWDIAKASGIDHYTFQAKDNHHHLLTDVYRVNIICDSSFGYEGVRLTWLNRFGAWDYYTFNQKSIRSLTTNKTQYTQLAGTWNKAKYSKNGFRGGKKNFKVNSKERLRLNTDFLNDLESVWMEELMNSPEVYIVNQYQYDELWELYPAGNYTDIIKKYIEPVIVTTSDFTRKTKANDKLIQYTIEVERNKTQRTQSM